MYVYVAGGQAAAQAASWRCTQESVYMAADIADGSELYDSCKMPSILLRLSPHISISMLHVPMLTACKF